MSTLPFSLQSLLLNSNHNLQPYRLYKGRNGVQWLFPAEPQLYRASLPLYEPHSLGGELRRTAMWWRLGGEAVQLACEGLENAIAEVIGQKVVRLALFINHPGSVGKVTALVLGPSGEQLAVAKFAQQPAGRQAITNEARTLEALGAVANLRGRVPSLLARAEYASREILVMSLGPLGRGPKVFGASHQEALARVQAPFKVRLPFRETAMWAFMSNALAACRPQLSGAWRARYDCALAALEQGLGDKEVVVSLAHRDFAPWNTRLGSEGLFVFDWETASQGYLLSYDYFHFQFMTAALLRRRITAADLAAWRFTPSCTGSPGPDASRLGLLAYLCDVGLSYHQAHLADTAPGKNEVIHYVARALDILRDAGPQLAAVMDGSGDERP